MARRPVSYLFSDRDHANRYENAWDHRAEFRGVSSRGVDGEPLPVLIIHAGEVCRVSEQYPDLNDVIDVSPRRLRGPFYS
jgi:hypothetical protein